MLFLDRTDAGRRLALHVQEFVAQELHPSGPLSVLALPRGGVPVGFEVAIALHAPLDVFVVRKLGAPGQEELAIGAIASGGVRVANEEIMRALGVSAVQLEDTTARELRELERREQAYRGNRPPLDVSAKTVILVDDGLATGYTMRAAIAAVRQRSPKRIIVAVPVAARSTCDDLSAQADAVLCLFTPFEFMAVGQWYRSFAQTSDDEVRDLLDRASKTV